MRRLLVATLFVSAAAIGYELVLMRMLSIVQWHHFAYMVISLALLGYGASGALLTLWRRPLLERFEARLTDWIRLAKSGGYGFSLEIEADTFSLLGDEYPRVRHEFEPLTRSLGIFTAMTAISVGSFYTLLKNHPWRFAAQGLLWAGIFLTGLYYWP